MIWRLRLLWDRSQCRRHGHLFGPLRGFHYSPTLSRVYGYPICTGFYLCSRCAAGEHVVIKYPPAGNGPLTRS
jgi:hypothetical protein